jgi:CubicO group peptidase (beta-lactamase class C family)
MKNKSVLRLTRAVLALTILWVLAPAPLRAQRAGHPEKPPVHIKTAKELESAISRVDQVFASEYAIDNLASATVGVISGPDLVWAKSYGMADIENKIPATKDSTYRIGSITKQFTGVMLLQLVAQGKVHLSDPVEKYYPEIRNVTNSYSYAPPITLIQLATHTSGLDREPGDVEVYTRGKVADWDKTLLAGLAHTKFAWEPGTRYSYSNIGYAILGQALSRAAGEPYIQYVQQHIIGPLGMTHTAFEQNDEILKTLAKGYIIRNGTADPKPSESELSTGRGYKIPNGAIFTTVGDLAKFVSLEMGDGPESIIKKSILADNFSRSSSATGDLKSGYGVGFMLSREGDLICVGHGGSVAGYVAGAYFNPPSHTGIIFLRNAAGRGFRNDAVMAALGALSK